MAQPAGLPPGVYVGLPSEEYHADPAIGSGGVKKLITEQQGSPLDYWWQSPLNPEREEDKDTSAKAFGTAYHMLILEPERFEAEYNIKWGVDKTSVAGMIGEGDYKRLMLMRAMLTRMPWHKRFASEGVPECSIFWRDEEAGLMCKIRADRFAPKWIVDLKTDENIHSYALRSSFVSNGYDVSGAMYSVGAQALKKMIRDGYKMPRHFSEQFVADFVAEEHQIFAFLYQGKEAPYIPRAWLVTPWLAEIGKEKMRRGLLIYGDNQHNEAMWPSGYDELENITEDMLSQSINY